MVQAPLKSCSMAAARAAEMWSERQASASHATCIACSAPGRYASRRFRNVLGRCGATAAAEAAMAAARMHCRRCKVHLLRARMLSSTSSCTCYFHRPTRKTGNLSVATKSQINNELHFWYNVLEGSGCTVHSSDVQNAVLSSLKCTQQGGAVATFIMPKCLFSSSRSAMCMMN
jgi:hypothetical protein